MVYGNFGTAPKRATFNIGGLVITRPREGAGGRYAEQRDAERANQLGPGRQCPWLRGADRIGGG